MRGQKILVVDDDLIIHGTLGIFLKSSGYQVLTALDLPQAMTVVRKEKPDLILLDFVFPPALSQGRGDMWDGLLILAMLRRMENAKRAPVILMSGADPARYGAAAAAAGITEFVHKPIVDPSKLLTAIRRALSPAGG